MRYRRIQGALALTLFLNMLVAGAKFLYGTLTGAVAMRADGIASIFDGFSNVVGIVGMSVATRPADDNHPYGHAKFEISFSWNEEVSDIAVKLEMRIDIRTET